MIATIKYKNIGRERKIIFDVLYQLKVNIIKTTWSCMTSNATIKFKAEDKDDIYAILNILNLNSEYGVQLLNYRRTFKECINNFLEWV